MFIFVIDCLKVKTGALRVKAEGRNSVPISVGIYAVPNAVVLVRCLSSFICCIVLY